MTSPHFPTNKISIIKFEQKYDKALETLLDKAFGAKRYQKSSYKLRKTSVQINELSYITVDDNQTIIASIAYWQFDIAGFKALLLGPLAVDPDYQNKGLGKKLINKTLQLAKQMAKKADWKMVILIGDLDYYSKSGFKQVPQGAINYPSPTDPKRILYQNFEQGFFENLITTNPTPLELNPNNNLLDFAKKIDNYTNTNPAPVEKWAPKYCGEIDLEIKANGQWNYMGSPIKRQKLIALFATVLWRDVKGDGAHYLITPAEKIKIKVEDSAFIATEMLSIGQAKQQKIIIQTNLAGQVTIGDKHKIRFTHDNNQFMAYVTIRHALEAKLTRSLCYQLSDYLLEKDDKYYLISDGQEFAL